MDTKCTWCRVHRHPDLDSRTAQYCRCSDETPALGYWDVQLRNQDIDVLLEALMRYASDPPGRHESNEATQASTELHSSDEATQRYNRNLRSLNETTQLPLDIRERNQALLELEDSIEADLEELGRLVEEMRDLVAQTITIELQPLVLVNTEVQPQGMNSLLVEEIRESR